MDGSLDNLQSQLIHVPSKQVRLWLLSHLLNPSPPVIIPISPFPFTSTVSSG